MLYQSKCSLFVGMIYHQPEIGHFIPATTGRGNAHAHGGLEPPVEAGCVGDYKGIHDDYTQIK